MARPRKVQQNAETKAQSSALLAALKFVAVCQKDTGKPFEAHCHIGRGFLSAFNGTVSAGCTIPEDIEANPHTLRFTTALDRCGSIFTVTQLNNDRLSVRSEKFQAVIPCVATSALQGVAPDQACATITDELKAGFIALAPLVADSSEYVVTASILLQAGSMVATNRHVMLEYWHGIDLPPNLIIPKAAALAVAKCDKPLASLGFSASSVTFWFDDKSFIRTQQYQERWPDPRRVLDDKCNAWPVPPAFYVALDAVMPFNADNRVYLKRNLLCSHREDGVGATYEIDGLPLGPGYNSKYLKLVEPFVKKIDFIGGSDNMRAMFFGDKVRGVIMGVAG